MSKKSRQYLLIFSLFILHSSVVIKAFDNLCPAGKKNVDWSKWLDNGGPLARMV